MYNRMDLVKTDLLMKLVGEYYEDKDIEDAKSLLFDKLPSQRNVKRKGDNKKEVNLKDILQALHSLPNEKQQSDHDADCLIFAAANCHFPSLEVKNIDAGTIVTDIVSLKQEVKELKEEKYQSQKLSDQMTELRSMVSELSALTKKNSSKKYPVFTNSLDPASNPNFSNSEPKEATENKPSPSWYVQTLNENSQENDQSKALYSEKVKKPGNSIVEKSRPMAKEVNNDKSWETVKKKKKTHLGKLSGSSLKTVPRRLLPADVFVSRLNPDTSESDMTYFVKLQFPQATNVTCTKLKTKFDSYSSFRIMLNGINFKDSLNPESWPNGVLIKRFYSPALSKNQAGSSAHSDNAKKLNNT